MCSKPTYVLTKVWGYDSDSEENIVEVYITFLRKELKLIGSKVSISVMRLVADASHELRAPLTVILSNSALLTKDNFIKAQEKPYNRAVNINSEARRMKLLVEDLLDLARHDSLKQKISLSKIDLSYIVLKTIMKFEAAIYDSGKKLRNDIDDGLCISSNTEQIQKLLGIFIDNAIKYSAKNGSISIELHRSGGEVSTVLSK